MARAVRAQEHLDELARRIDAATTGAVSKMSASARYGQGTFEATFRPKITPPLEWSILIGEVLYNLRSSLDHLAFQFPGRPAEIPEHRVSFPIFDKREAFEDHMRRNLPHLPGAAVERMDALQPYGGWQGPQRAGQVHRLWLLNELCNVDKHRNLHFTQFFIRQTRYDVRGATGPVEEQEFFRGGPVRDGTVLLKIRAAGVVDVDFWFAPDITFDHATSGVHIAVDLSSAGVVDTLGQIHSLVADTILPDFRRRFF